MKTCYGYSLEAPPPPAPPHCYALMSTHNICFYGKIRLEMCPQCMDAPAVGYLTIKLQNSTWYKCLNLSLTGSRMYVRTYTHSYRRTYIRTRTHVRKTEKLYAPGKAGIIRCRDIKNIIWIPLLSGAMIIFNNSFNTN